jgi:hypothetical protein
VEALYLPAVHGENPLTSGRGLGFNAGRRRLNDLVGATLTGRLHDCTEAHEAAARREDELNRNLKEGEEGTIVMVTGFCHYYSDGPYLRVADASSRALPRNFERLLRGNAPAGLGDLIPMPPRWRARAEVEQVATEFLDRLRGGDARAMLAFRMPDPQEARDPRWSEPGIDRMLFRNPRAVFAELRRSKGSVDTEILIDRDAEDDGRRSAVVCYCRKPACTGLWPIDSVDTDTVLNGPTRASE